MMAVSEEGRWDQLQAGWVGGQVPNDFDPHVKHWQSSE
jgi:hypothetical protein